MPSTLVVAGAAFLGGMATSSVLSSSTKSRVLAHAKTAHSIQECRNSGFAAGKTDALAGRTSNSDPWMAAYFKGVTSADSTCLDAFRAEYKKAYARFAKPLVPGTPLKIAVQNQPAKGWYTW
jgi:hypothetical protein